MRIGSIILLAVATAATACVDQQRPESCEEPRVTIAISVTIDQMTPDTPGVCRGQDVTLTVDAEVDGFLPIHGLDDLVPIIEITDGERTEVEFTADRSGQFPIELHPDEDPEGIALGVLTVHEP